MVYQHDVEATTNLAFVVCSAGALMSVVFAVMGIKWWFRRRITFSSDNDGRDRGTTAVDERITSTDNHAEQLSLMNTGVYRRTADADGYAPIERPTTLPPVKIRSTQFNQRRLPTLPRPQSSNDTSRLEKFPEPDEIIPVATNRIIPSTIKPKDDLHKPVVVDIHIPVDDGLVEHNLTKPEIHQRLHLNQGNNFTDELESRMTRSYIEMDGGRGGGDLHRQSNPYETISPERKVIHELNEDYTMEYNENYEPYTTVIKLGGEDLSRSSSLDTNAIEQDAQKSLGSSPSNNWIPNPIMKPRRSFLSDASSDSNPILNVTSEEVNVHVTATISASNPELELSNEEKMVSENQVRSYSVEDDLEIDMTPLDVSKITSPVPKRSKRGLVKNKRAPPPPTTILTREDEVKAASPTQDIERNITRIYIGPNNGEDDPFTQTPIEVEPSHWVTFEKCKPVESNSEGHSHIKHNIHHQILDFNTVRGVELPEDEISAELGLENPRAYGVQEENIGENTWREVNLQENDAKHIPTHDHQLHHDINQNFLNRWSEIDEEKIYKELGIDKNLVKIEPLLVVRRSQDESQVWEAQTPHDSSEKEKVWENMEFSNPPTPPTTSPPLFDDDFGDNYLENLPDNKSKVRKEITGVETKYEADSRNEKEILDDPKQVFDSQERRPSLLQLYVENDVVKTPQLGTKESNHSSFEGYQASFEPSPEEAVLIKPIPKARTASIEDLTGSDYSQNNNDDTSFSEASSADMIKSIPTPPPRLKIYVNTPNTSNTEIKSILKNNKQNKNVRFDQTQPTVIIPTLLSPDSSVSPGLTPITPMSDLVSPPLTPAPVLVEAPNSPVLIPREYRRGLLDPINESKRSEDGSSDDYDTDSLDEGLEKKTKFTEGFDDSDSDNDDKIRTRMITRPSVPDARHSQIVEELKEREVKRDYVAAVPRTLRDMRKQQEEEDKRTDKRFRDSLSEDESII